MSGKEEEIPLTGAAHGNIDTSPQFNQCYIDFGVAFRFQYLVSDISLLKDLLKDQYFEEYKNNLIGIGTGLESILNILCEENFYNVSSVRTSNKSIKKQLDQIKQKIEKHEPRKKSECLSKLAEIETKLEPLLTACNQAAQNKESPEEEATQLPLPYAVIKGWIDELTESSHANLFLFVPHMKVRAKRDFLAFKVSTVFVVSGLIQAAAIRIMTEYRPSQTLYTYLAVPCGFALLCVGTVAFGLIKSYRQHQHNRRPCESENNQTLDLESGNSPLVIHTKSHFKGHYATYGVPLHFQKLVSKILALRENLEKDLYFKKYMNLFTEIANVLTKISSTLHENSGLEAKRNKRRSGIDLQVANNSTAIQTLVGQINAIALAFKPKEFTIFCGIREEIKENLELLTSSFTYAINGHKNSGEYPPPETVRSAASIEEINEEINKIGAPAPELHPLAFIPHIEVYAKNYTRATKITFLFTLSGLIQAPAMYGMTKLFPTKNIYTYLVVPALFAAIGVIIVSIALGKSHQHKHPSEDREYNPIQSIQDTFRALQHAYSSKKADTGAAASASTPLFSQSQETRDNITKLQSYLANTSSRHYDADLAKGIRNFFQEHYINPVYGSSWRTGAATLN